MLAEFGTAVSEEVAVEVHDSTAETRYLVIPARPEGTDGWSEKQLLGCISRDSMIGTALAKKPDVA